MENIAMEVGLRHKSAVWGGRNENISGGWAGTQKSYLGGVEREVSQWKLGWDTKILPGWGSKGATIAMEIGLGHKNTSWMGSKWQYRN